MFVVVFYISIECVNLPALVLLAKERSGSLSFLALEIEWLFYFTGIAWRMDRCMGIGAGSICIISTQSLQMGLSTDIISNEQKSQN